jgi:hypothetical protein
MVVNGFTALRFELFGVFTALRFDFILHLRSVPAALYSALGAGAGTFLALTSALGAGAGTFRRVP